MKLLFSCFMVPVYLTIAVAGLGGLFIYLDSIGFRPVENTHSFLSNMYFCLLHLSMALSLGLAVLSFIYCLGMAAAGFIIKTWFGAGIAIAGAVGMFMLARFLLNTTI